MGRKIGSVKGRHPTSVTDPITGKTTRPVLYQRWMGMHQRCYNPKSHIFRFYGGRGIKVCERWHGRAGYDNFCDDMGDPNGLTLDRRENDRDYSPENCRWVTQKQQVANRRSTKGIARNPDSLRQKALRAGIPYHVAYMRVRDGWAGELALSTPVQPRGRKPGATRANGWKPQA